MNPTVDFYFGKGQWQNEITALRKIALDCGLKEELKWGCPCYTFQKKNIVLIHVFKEYCAFLFFKGVLLNDAKGVLIQQTKNVQSARQARFTNTKEIVKLAPILKTYIYEAIEVEKAGLQVKMKTTDDYEVPAEFQQKLDKMPALKKAFSALTPGRQRAYLFHFAQAKQSATRTARVEKYVEHILKGKGIGG